MTFETWLRLLQITCVSIIVCLVSQAHAQVPQVSASGEKGDQKSTEVVISEVSPDFASPRDTINTFLLNMAQIAEDQKNRAAIKQVYRTLDAP